MANQDLADLPESKRPAQIEQSVVFFRALNERGFIVRFQTRPRFLHRSEKECGGETKQYPAIQRFQSADESPVGCKLVHAAKSRITRISPSHSPGRSFGLANELPMPASASTPSAASTPTAATAAISARAVIAALVVLTLGRTALSVLFFGVEILRGPAVGGVALIHALFVLLGVGLAAWMLLLIARLVLLRRCLAVGVLLLIALSALLGFLLILGRVHTAPATTAIGLLPAGAGVFVNIPVVASVHVAVG